jgi:DNA invertase Pin-like site-specific DNA recombinase
MLEVARKRQIDMMLVWRYDRFAQSTQALVHALRACQRLGVDSIGDQDNLDTTTPPGKMICTVMVSLAQCERVLISKRVKAGMPRARAQGSGYPRRRFQNTSRSAWRISVSGGLDSADEPAAGNRVWYGAE